MNQDLEKYQVDGGTQDLEKYQAHGVYQDSEKYQVYDPGVTGDPGGTKSGYRDAVQYHDSYNAGDGRAGNEAMVAQNDVVFAGDDDDVGNENLFGQNSMLLANLCAGTTCLVQRCACCRSSTTRFNITTTTTPAGGTRVEPRANQSRRWTRKMRA